MTSNPTIFEKAIAGSTDYAKHLQELAKRKDLDAKGIYEQLAIQRHSGCRGRAAARLRSNEAARRLRQPRSLALSGAQDAGDDGRGAPAVEDRGPRKHDDQGARHARRNSRDSAAHQRGHQYQRDTAFRAGCVRESRRSLYCGLEAVRQEWRRREPHRQRGELFRQPH